MASQWEVRTRIDYEAINSVRGEEKGKVRGVKAVEEGGREEGREGEYERGRARGREGKREGGN